MPEDPAAGDGEHRGGGSRLRAEHKRAVASPPQEAQRQQAPPQQPPSGRPGKLDDVTGPAITGRWGMPCTDLGAAVLAPNGKLVAVFGDTFAGAKALQGDWRSPVVLIGTGDASNLITWEGPGGPDRQFARQLWHYVHDLTPDGSKGGISTVLPSDLLRVEDTLYLHAMVNRGFGNVVWTEIWRSTDSGVSWQHMGEKAKFAGTLHNGFAQCWAWDYDPDDSWVYVVSTGFQRDKGIILRRVRPEDIGDRDEYFGWCFTDGNWTWAPVDSGNQPTPITPEGEKWGELTLRRLGRRKWILGGFLASEYALGYRTIDSPVANVHKAPIQLPVRGTHWHTEDHSNSKVAQLYGGYVLPGSRLDVAGGVGLLVSQWHTNDHWPYKVMQFQATLQDTTEPKPRPVDPSDL
ncbi:MAG: DUF4185 domain-containing protein [Mycobacterium sp.]